MTSPHPDYIKAGKIAARVLKEIGKEIMPEAKLAKLSSLAEKKVIEYGGKPAFPCTVCVNHIAAHRTSPRNDPAEIPDFGLVKVDVGAHVNGRIADTALTVDIDGSLAGFIDATDDALNEAISLMKPGEKLENVGRQIEKVIKAYGLRPISNLTGHSMKRFRLHAEKVVPNTKKRGVGVIEIGDYYAVEPYATSGSGKVFETEHIYIFSNSGADRPLTGTTEKLRGYLRKKYGPLPFAMRWIRTSSKDVDITSEFKELLKHKAIIGHPMQIEKSGRPVSISEHTVFIADEGAVVLTQRD
ncbi:MAG: type II methionyl aminopeptidase [Candidatus Hodarchaeota archaeon]